VVLGDDGRPLPRRRASRTTSECADDLCRVCHTGAMGRPKTIEEYLESFTGQAHELLERLRALAQEAVPEATEAVKWSNEPFSV
jgi:hypothetical protein